MIRMRGVVAIGVAAEADDLGVDPGAAGLCVFVFFEHQRARAFADHEAVAILVEWCRRGGRRVVFLRGRKQRVEHRGFRRAQRSEEHTSELQSLMRISYAVFCLKKKKTKNKQNKTTTQR